MFIQTLIPDPGSLWFFVFFLAMWFTITGLLSTLSGWRSVATNWRAQGQDSGKSYCFVSGAIGAKLFTVRYGRVVEQILSSSSGRLWNAA